MNPSPDRRGPTDASRPRGEVSGALNVRWAAALLAEWLNSGLEHVVVCPGSRSTPLALIAANTPGLTVHSVVDERSGGFVALGLALSTSKPVGLVVTSGTAGANAYPAVIEAHEVGAQLWVATADRPWELLHFGAPQTIDQRGLFGRFAASVELPVPEEGEHLERHIRALVSRACATSVGPIHFNVPFREPLVPPAGEPLPIPNRTNVPVRMQPQPSLEDLNARLLAAKRPLVVCGPRARSDGFANKLHEWAAAHGVPVLAEACSNARYGYPRAIAQYDTLLRVERFSSSMRPDLVLRFGGGLTSKVLNQWLTAPSVVVHESGAVVDPQHQALAILDGAAADVVAGLGRCAPEAGWSERWTQADGLAREALTGLEHGEPAIARAVAAALPEQANLVVASSMPIRDLDGFASTARAIRVFANRGVNGIDGTVSTAVGVALGTGRPTVLLTGDLAALHDLHGFVTARRLRPRLSVVVVNNDGGGIFHFLPVREQAPFEKLWATPHGLGFSEAASLAGWPHVKAADAVGLRAALVEGLEQGALIELRTDRESNLRQHAELHAKVAAAMEARW
ncbi:MAG: 2-succinyl-5-enolpyruvyl-6-hydroxy-3-cyclohexene-1-carboxylic-acid synthase [Myxococcaceae bacterium]